MGPPKPKRMKTSRQGIVAQAAQQSADEEAAEKGRQEANEEPRESSQTGYFLRSSQEVAQAAEEVKNNHLNFFFLSYLSNPFSFFNAIKVIFAIQFKTIFHMIVTGN